MLQTLLKRSEFLRNLFTATVGTVAAQLIPVLGYVIIARNYSPAEFGLFATWIGLISIIAVLITGRLEHALTIEPDGKPRQRAVISILITISIATFALCVPLSLLGVYVLKECRTEMIVMIMPTAFFLAATQTWHCWCAAEGRFNDLTILRMAQAIAVTGLQVAIGFIRPTATTLAVAHMGGVFFGVLISVWRLPLGKLPIEWRHNLLSFWSRHRYFPLFSLPADMINSISGQLPLLIVGAHFGPEAAGYLALTLRALGAPIGILGIAVADVFKRHAGANWRDHGQCRNVYLKTFRILALYACGMAVIVVFFSEPLFVLPFGEKWRLSGTIALWLLPVFTLRFMASPLSHTFYIAGKQRIDLVWQVILLGVTILSLSMPSQYVAALCWYSAGYSAMYLLYLSLSYRFSLGERV